jgi:hypothetical protein
MSHPVIALPRGTSITAAAALALMAALGGGAHALVLTPLLAGEAVPASSVTAAVAALAVVATLDVIVAIGLYDALAGAGRWLSTLAAAFRLAYAAVFGAAIGMLALGGTTALETFDSVWSLSLGLFGTHLLLVGVLVFRAGGTGRIVGPLVSLAGAGYAIDSYAGILAPDAGVALAQFTFVGEVVLIGWLVVRAIRRPHAR